MSNLGGSGGMLPQKIFKFRVSKCHLLHFLQNIFRKYRQRKMQWLVVYFTPSLRLLVKVQCLRQKNVKQGRHQGDNKQRERCVPFRQVNSVIMPSISITSLCLCTCMCRIARELNLSSVMVLRKKVCSLFIPLKLCILSRASWHTVSQQSYMESYIYSGIELGLAQSKVSTKVWSWKS